MRSLFCSRASTHLTNMAQGYLALTVLLGLGCQASVEPRFDKDEVKPVAATAAPPQQPAAPAAQAEPEVRPAHLGDPYAGKTFSLDEATAGLPPGKALAATIETTAGTLECKLFADKAPLTVANFVGLARGLRPFLDRKANGWVRRPLYDGTPFHRTIPGFMIQGGDPLGNGMGEVGYTIRDELHPSLSHNRAGLLCMANRGPHTNGSQFFIMDGAAPHLDDAKTYTIFGDCGPVELIHKIASAPLLPQSDRPAAPVVMTKVVVHR